MVHWHLDDASAHPAGVNWNEAVHFAIEAHADHHVLSVGFQRASIVIQFHAGYF